MFQTRHLSYKRLRTWYAGLVKAKPHDPPYSHIVQIGDPNLRSKSQQIPPDLITSPEITFLIDQMKKVMRNYNCVGLSAPQIGIPANLFLMEFTFRHLKAFSPQEQKNREMEIIPFTVVINPSIKITDYTKLNFIETCESVRGLHATVARYRALQLTATSPLNESWERTYSGWAARIIQHEIDHLNGILYTDIMERKSLCCSCWEVINERGGKVELPYGCD